MMNKQQQNIQIVQLNNWKSIIGDDHMHVCNLSTLYQSIIIHKCIHHVEVLPCIFNNYSSRLTHLCK